MKKPSKLKRLFLEHSGLWDCPEIRPWVRSNIKRFLDCGTRALPAIHFRSPSGEEELILPHTCKSKICPSCGYRATLEWQKSIECDLPDIEYVGVTFTVPEVFWDIFRNNRFLLDAFPAIGAAALMDWADRKFCAHIAVMPVLHTFGGKLNFYPHLHILAGTVGLHHSEKALVKVHFSKDQLGQAWRKELLDYLLQALDRGLISSTTSQDDLKELFTRHYDCWWKIGIQHCYSRKAFVRYISRYLRRPPLPERNLLAFVDEKVLVKLKDTRQGDRVQEELPAAELVLRLLDHVPDRYRHGVRYFGLLAPRCRGRRLATFFHLLGYSRRPRPGRTSWRRMRWETSGIDPLETANGEIMEKIGWMAPEPAQKRSEEFLKE